MKITRFLLFYSILFITLQIISAVFPSHFNWGIHFLAFYDKTLIVLFCILIILFMFEQVRSSILTNTDKILKNLKRRNFKLFSNLIIISIFTLIVILFPVKLNLLGDGALLLREISNIWPDDEIPLAYNHQFLIGIIIKILKLTTHPHSIEQAQFVYRVIAFIAGILFIIIVFKLMKLINIKPSEKFFTGLMVMCSGGSLLFIGYVENYALLYITVSAFVVTGWMALTKNTSIIFPIFFYLLSLGLHIATIVFLPAILLLLYLHFENKKILTISLISITLLFSVLILFVFKKEFNIALEQAISESRWSLLPLFKSDLYFAYSMFSFYHVVDWLNANFLMAPFGLAILIGSVLFEIKSIEWRNPVTIFLYSTTILGLIFTFITHFALGMARDWDFMASFFIPLIFLSIYIISRINLRKNISTTIIMVSGITLFHFASWVGVNGNADRSIARMKLLDNPALLGYVPRLNYYENMGSYYWWNNSYIEAKYYFEKYLELNSENPRILGNMAAIYTKLNEREKLFGILKRAAEVKSPNPGIYINLGVEYSRRGDTTNALKNYLIALQLDSTRAKAYANIGSLFIKQKKFALAKDNLKKAIHFGLNDPLIFRELGYASLYLNEYQEAIKNFDVYLDSNRNDSIVISIRDQLVNYLSKLNNYR